MFFRTAARNRTGVVHLAGIVGDKKPDGRLPHAVAVDALHTHADRSGEQSGHPEPSERCTETGCHFVTKLHLKVWATAWRVKFAQHLQKKVEAGAYYGTF